MPLLDYADEVIDLKTAAPWWRKPAPGWLRPALTILLCTGIYAVMKGA